MSSKFANVYKPLFCIFFAGIRIRKKIQDTKVPVSTRTRASRQHNPPDTYAGQCPTFSNTLYTHFVPCLPCIYIDRTPSSNKLPTFFSPLLFIFQLFSPHFLSRSPIDFQFLSLLHPLQNSCQNILLAKKG